MNTVRKAEAIDFFALMGYRVVREVGSKLYMEHVETGRRSCIGSGNVDEQWLMGGNWTEPEKIAVGSSSRH